MAAISRWPCPPRACSRPSSRNAGRTSCIPIIRTCWATRRSGSRAGSTARWSSRTTRCTRITSITCRRERAGCASSSSPWSPGTAISVTASLRPAQSVAVDSPRPGHSDPDRDPAHRRGCPAICPGRWCPRSAGRTASPRRPSSPATWGVWPRRRIFRSWRRR